MTPAADHANDFASKPPSQAAGGAGRWRRRWPTEMPAATIRSKRACFAGDALNAADYFAMTEYQAPWVSTAGAVIYFS